MGRLGHRGGGARMGGGRRFAGHRGIGGHRGFAGNRSRYGRGHWRYRHFGHHHGTNAKNQYLIDVLYIITCMHM